jgi:hypothetical protein
VLTGSQPKDAISLGFERDVFAQAGDHIAYFWDSEDDFVRAVSFIDIGVSEGDHCVVFGHDDANAKVIAILRSRGVDSESLAAGGRLAIVRGQTNADAMLADIGAVFTRMLAAGATTIRLLGNIGWGRSGWPQEGDLLAFEGRVTAAIAGLPCVVVCMYDLHAMPPHLIVRAGFGTHPFTIASRVPVL